MIVSHYNDNSNIFHIVLKEFPVLIQYTKDYNQRYDIVLKNTKGDSNVLDYRKFLYTPFFNVVTYNINKPESINLHKFPYALFNPFKFQHVKLNNDFCNALCRIKDYYYVSSNNSPAIIFSLRKSSRILYDTKSKTNFEELITQKYGKESIVYFECMTPFEQLQALQNCKIFCGIHGANLVNMIFTRSFAHVIEIDFKTHWYCDPVCSDHLQNKLQPWEQCKGKLTRGYYHKADYHNLALLCGKTYTSISTDYCENFLDKNPINVKNVYADFNKLSNCIDNALTSMDKL